MRPFLCSTEMTIPSSRPAERQSAAHRRCPGCRHAAPAKPAQSVLHSAEHGATIRPPKGRGVTAPQSRFDKTVGGPTALFADGHEDVVGWVEARRSALEKQHCMARRNPPAATQNGGFRRATPCINEMQCNAAQPTLRRCSLTVTKKRSPRHVEGNA